MAMWHCPNCGTPQAESARCWVCHRSSTTCSTCRHFRQSLAATVGYCGLDRRRLPLTGTELRGCWTGPLPGTESEPPYVVTEVDPGVRLRGFVPVELVARAGPSAATPASDAQSAAAVPGVAFDPSDGWTNRTTLFGDAEA
jgi:hypothetical protein